ncbi:MAG: hypothetical protein FJ011_25655 [Chloroflexi bacterium]|nr:hypothetical protein [Chloroflexota bacterium]
MDASLRVMVMVWIRCDESKFLFIIPAQQWGLCKKLVAVINVTAVEVDAHLEAHLAGKFRPDLEDELISSELPRLDFSYPCAQGMCLERCAERA